MVNRIQNRNPSYSDNFFKNPNIDTISSIEGATALKLDEQMEVKPSTQQLNKVSLEEEVVENLNNTQENISMVLIENASYIENNIVTENSNITDEITRTIFGGKKGF